MTEEKNKKEERNFVDVITVGCFDMLHEGHVNILNAMREGKGEANVIYNPHIIIHDDLSIFENKGRFPVQDLEQRIENLRRIGHDSISICYDADPTNELMILINRLRSLPYLTRSRNFLYIRGDDWADFPGRKYLEREGIEIMLIPYTKSISSTKRRADLF